MSSQWPPKPPPPLESQSVVWQLIICRTTCKYMYDKNILHKNDTCWSSFKQRIFYHLNQILLHCFWEPPTKTNMIWHVVESMRYMFLLVYYRIYFTGLYFNISLELPYSSHIIEFPIFDTELVSNIINHALVSLQSIHPVCIRYLHSQLSFIATYGDKYQWFILCKQILFM